MPSAPKQIFIHDNVKIASDVVFCNHDIANAMLNVKYGVSTLAYYLADIEIFDNVLIGCNVLILPGKKIGCSRGDSCEHGTVVAGNPIRKIG